MTGSAFFELSGFNLVIVKPDRRITYSGCEWNEISESAGINDTVLEGVSLIASHRMELSMKEPRKVKVRRRTKREIPGQAEVRRKPKSFTSGKWHPFRVRETAGLKQRTSPGHGADARRYSGLWEVEL